MTSRGALNFWILQSQSMFSSTDKSRSYWIVMGHRWLKKTKGFLINLENRALKQDQQYSNKYSGEQGWLCVAKCRSLLAVASLVAHRLQGLQAQQSWITGFLALRHVESSRTRDGTHDPCTGRQSPIHHATRDVLWGLSSWCLKKPSAWLGCTSG